MKAVFGRRAALLLFSAALVVPVGGCAVGWRSFSFDSTSRVPFFGFELQERKSKSSAPSYNSISRTDSVNSRIETALRMEAGSPRSLRKSDVKSLVGANVFGTLPEVKNEDSHAHHGEKCLQPLSIPLPVTTEPKKPMERRLTGTVPDFQ